MCVKGIRWNVDSNWAGTIVSSLSPLCSLLPLNLSLAWSPIRQPCFLLAENTTVLMFVYFTTSSAIHRTHRAVYRTTDQRESSKQTMNNQRRRECRTKYVFSRPFIFSKKKKKSRGVDINYFASEADHRPYWASLTNVKVTVPRTIKRNKEPEWGPGVRGQAQCYHLSLLANGPVLFHRMF